MTKTVYSRKLKNGNQAVGFLLNRERLDEKEFELPKHKKQADAYYNELLAQSDAEIAERFKSTRQTIKQSFGSRYSE